MNDRLHQLALFVRTVETGASHEQLENSALRNLPPRARSRRSKVDWMSEIFLMPTRQLAVIVLVNSRSPAGFPFHELSFRPAPALATNVAYNLLFAGTLMERPRLRTADGRSRC
jgi:hypothetical protein